MSVCFTIVKYLSVSIIQKVVAFRANVKYYFTPNFTGTTKRFFVATPSLLAGRHGQVLFDLVTIRTASSSHVGNALSPGGKETKK